MVWVSGKSGVGDRGFVPVRVGVYDYGDVFGIDGGVESTPMYCLL